MSTVIDSAARSREAPQGPAALLEVRGVTKRFGGVLANHGISLSVARGDLVAVIGPNGSGKTTLLEAICGRQPPDSGEVWFDGCLLRGRSVTEVARMGLVRTFQQTAVYDGLSAVQNVEASIERSGETLSAMWKRSRPEVRERALECLDFVGLADRASTVAGELSYGQRKLLELAMALMSGPKLLLLDEPAAGVSPALLPEIVRRLQRANAERGITVLFIEHDMQVVSMLARHVHCLVRGRLLASGTPAEVRADPRVLESYLGGT
jgi:branched-chain amino acid transport system ATP-binding protein